MVAVKNVVEKEPGDKKKGRANWIDKHVGQTLRYRRSLMGLSQQDLAGKLGITFQQLQKYENGTNRISAGRLYEIANNLNVSVSFFFENCDGSEPVENGSSVSLRKTSDVLDAPDIMDSKETLSLLRTFYAIEDAGLRQNLIKLTSELVKNLKEVSES